MKIICVGAGASGLVFAYKLQRSFERFELTIYDKNVDVGGTWLENRYPGCACDVPSHIYTWSFEPKTDWNSVYSGSTQIFEYFKEFSEKYDLRKYCKFRHMISSAIWDDNKGQWDVEITDLNTNNVVKDQCDILINAAGVLNAWKWPDIPGLDDYKGVLLHTAKWNETVDLSSKTVGLIGNGSSAIQMLPAIHDKVEKVINFVREPTWVAPNFGEEQHIFSEEERQSFLNPESHLQYRKKAESAMNAIFEVFRADSETQKTMAGAVADTMEAKLNNPDLAAKLIPKWPFGCRRMTPGPNYLETIRSKKVEVVFGGIDRITENGCLASNEKEYPVDVLICATGFNTSYVPRFPIVGLEGRNLIEEWSNDAKSYFGIGAAGFPNYFTLIGPNSPIGNGPVLIAVEAQVDYMLKLINRWQTENIHRFSPKAEAIEDFIAFKDQFMKDTVWAKDCRSWKITALWPGSTLHYLEALKEPRYDDWDIKYSGNRFAYLGNGSSQTEVDMTSDTAYYVRDHDDSPYLSRSKQRKVETKSGTMQR
ncbi:hypothetical protein BDQ17DRAFT_1389720 [Cyathus striatus]|nr:hypothetical protein BDQ17DRAFT_1389720 [Cyathus striatus]